MSIPVTGQKHFELNYSITYVTLSKARSFDHQFADLTGRQILRAGVRAHDACVSADNGNANAAVLAEAIHGIDVSDGRGLGHAVSLGDTRLGALFQLFYHFHGEQRRSAAKAGLARKKVGRSLRMASISILMLKSSRSTMVATR